MSGNFRYRDFDKRGLSLPILRSDDDGVQLDGYDWDDTESAFVEWVLGFCGCGEPELIVDVMVGYLSALKVWDDKGDDVTDEEMKAIRQLELDACDGNEGYLHLVQYVAYFAGLTTHGGSVGGAWLEDKGKLWLAALSEAVPVSPPSETAE